MYDSAFLIRFILLLLFPLRRRKSLVSEFISVDYFRSHKARSHASVYPLRPGVYEIFMKSLSHMDCETDFFKKARDGILFRRVRLLTWRGTRIRKTGAHGVRAAAWDCAGTTRSHFVCVCVCLPVCIQWVLCALRK